MSSPPIVAIYRDELLRISEPFIRAQAEALRRFVPFYVGSKRVPGLELPEDRVVLLRRSVLGVIAEGLYKTAGVAPGLERSLSRLAPVLVHAHYGPDASLVLPLAVRLRIPLVVTFHGYDATIADPFARRSFYRHRVYVRRRGWLMREAGLIVAVSEFIRGRLLQQGFPPARVRVHYIGLDTEQFRHDPAVPREPLVLFVGRLVEKKGCRHLINAVASLRSRVPDLQLVIIGDGPLRGALERMAASSLDRVRFLGWQPADAVRSWMNRARVLSVPSVTAESGDAEGLGMVFLEAQAMGLPVVSFASGGVPEAVAHGETGILVEEGDWQALAAAIAQLFDSSDLWRRLSAAGRQRVEERFDLRRQTNLLETLYDDLIRTSMRGAVGPVPGC